MVNQLTPSKVDAILRHHEEGRSIRGISRAMGVCCETVNRYVGHAARERKATASMARHRTGPPSKCMPFRHVILERLGAGLTVLEIYQHLVTDHGFQGVCGSLSRFVHGIHNELEQAGWIDYGQQAVTKRREAAQKTYRQTYDRFYHRLTRPNSQARLLAGVFANATDSTLTLEELRIVSVPC